MSGEKSRIATQLEWGTWHVWRKDVWGLQFYFPYIRWEHSKRELFIDLDITARLGKNKFGFRIFGFGFGVAIKENIKKYRNDGLCYHGVSLKRTCKSCYEYWKEKRQVGR